jgi:hypothetical protein
MPLIIGVLGALGLAAYITAMQQRWDRDRISFVLTFPRDMTPAALVAVLRSLASLGSGTMRPVRSIVFEVVAQARTVQHRLHVPRVWAETVQAALTVELPGLALDPLPTEEPPLQFQRGLELRPVGDSALLRTDTLEAGTRRLLTAFRPTAQDEMLMLQWVAVPLGPGPRPTRSRTARSRQSWLAQFLVAFWQTPEPGEPISLADQRAKVAEPHFEATARIVASAPTRQRAKQLIGRVQSALAVVEAPVPICVSAS